MPRSTQSEIVVPVFASGGGGSGERSGAGSGPGPRKLLAVLDIDSDHPAAFDEVRVPGAAAAAGVVLKRGTVVCVWV